MLNKLVLVLDMCVSPLFLLTEIEYFLGLESEHTF